MKTHIAAALLAGASILTSMPAHAYGGVNWSVTVGGGGYYPVYPSAGVVVGPQSPYIYGAPPAAFAPPPIYVQPAPIYRAYPPPVLYVNPYPYNKYPYNNYPYNGYRGGNGKGHHGHWNR
jgi:hypothetical protein